jgi:ethanolamine permease
MGVVAPAFSFSNACPEWLGRFRCVRRAGDCRDVRGDSFAIWFFLAIEGAAMAAEEAKDPKRTIPKAYISGILTLVLLAMGVMFFAGGVGDWRTLSNINDPLPQAMKTVVGDNSGWLHMLVWIGLFGLVASFHGIILGYSRQFFALARAGYLPASLAKLSRFQTPPGDHRRRRDRHRRDLQRRPDQPWRHDPDRGDDHHGRVRRHRDVHHEHAQPVQTA